jgi:hypothetical protein
MVETSRGPHHRNVAVSGSHFAFLTDRAIHDVVLHELRSLAAATAPRELPAPTPLRRATRPVSVAA